MADPIPLRPRRGVSPAARALPRWHYLVALLAGAANTLSFAPTPHGGWLELAIFVVYFAWLTRSTGWKSAALTGGAFGFGNFVTGVWWLYVSMHDYGGMPAPLAGAALVLFSMYLAVYPALAAGVWSFCAGHASHTARTGNTRQPAAQATSAFANVRDGGAPGGNASPISLTSFMPFMPFMPTWHGAFAFASAWAIGEWLRGLVFTGFPWLASGYAQVDGPFAGFAPVAGVYGVGWVLALAAALIVQAWARWREAPAALSSEAHNGGERNEASALEARTGERSTELTSKRISTSTGISASEASTARIALPAIGAALLIAAGLLLPFAQWTLPANAPLRVRLLQGNVKQEMKFEESGVLAAINEYQQMITAQPADLIVTPETAIPVVAQQLPPPFALAVRHFADSSGSSILFGALGGTTTSDGGVTDFTNSLFGVTPGTRDVYRYDKHHLVPLGEFVPWGFRWFIDLMKIPMGDLARGAPVQKPFMVHNQPVAVDICYEDIFGEEIARSIRESDTSPGVLVNSTNLAWFGDTIALDQHLQIARMRSLETGRPMLRATNTGTTAAIDANGKVLGRLAPYTVGALEVTVQGRSGNTPYVTSGNTTVLAISVLLLALGFAFGPGRVNGGRRREKHH